MLDTQYITRGSQKKSFECALLCSFLLLMPLVLDRESEEVTALLYFMLEGPVSNHNYWQTKGSIGLDGHFDKSSDFFLLISFSSLCCSMTLTQPTPFTVHLIPIYWLSRGPAVHRVPLLSEWQGDAVRGTEPLNAEELLWNPPRSFIEAQAV